MNSNAADAERQRWLIIKNKVFHAKDLTLEQKAAAWKQLTLQGLVDVERRLLLVDDEKELTAVLLVEIAGASTTPTVPGSDNDGLRHQQELKRVAQEAATAAAHKVMSQFKRQRLSVTDHAGIGKDLLEDGCTVKPQLLPVQYTTLPGVVDWEFKNDWKNTTNEDGVQVLATKLFQAIRKGQSGRR